MQEIKKTNSQIEFIETMSTGMRIFLFVCGLFPWIAPYELLIKPGWDGFNLFTFFFLIISLGAISVSLGFLGGAILGLNQTLCFDAVTRIALYKYENTLMNLREKRYPFREITSIEIYTHEWESRSNTFSLQITFSDKRKVQVGDIFEKAEAEKIQDTLQQWIAK
jgi:hypothetical protein